MLGTSQSSPTHFAFEPPVFADMSSYPLQSSSFPMGSSSSSDSVDNSLPRISRDFAPPSMNDRRPATAQATLHGLDKKRLEDINESAFQNPFAAPANDMVTPQSVDPHFVESNWASPSTVGPAYTNGVYPYALPNGIRGPSATSTRPQTSDGLPSYPTHLSSVPLPSARTIVGPAGHPYPPNVTVPAYPGGGFPARYGSFDQAGTRYMSLGLSQPENELQFVSLAGPAPKKRSRRRYDEIERIYACGHKGCDKAYGTLNHLNAHVSMQKHGPKRLPAEFKEMRKEWRQKKRQEANEAAQKEIQQAAAHAEASKGAAPEYAYSMPVYPPGYMPMEDPFAHRGSTASFLSSHTWSGSDTRPTTANTVSSADSPTDGRFSYTVPAQAWSVPPSAGPYDRKLSQPSMPVQGASFQPYLMNQQPMV